ncbi:MAG: hypothetical protein Q4A15_08890, partial [Prevotellaceae bacterium]|nr:hypothetical protein [Prevotellaceae bacterium]
KYTIPYYYTTEDFTIDVWAVKDVEEYTVTFDSGDTGLKFLNNVGEVVTKAVVPSHSTANDFVAINILPALIIDETTLESTLYTVDKITAVDADGEEVYIEDGGYSSDSLLKYFYIPSGILCNDATVTVTSKKAGKIKIRSVSVADKEDTLPISVPEIYSEFGIAEGHAYKPDFKFKLNIGEELYVDGVYIVSNGEERKIGDYIISEDGSWCTVYAEEIPSGDFEVYATGNVRPTIRFNYDNATVKISGREGLVEKNKEYPIILRGESTCVEFFVDSDSDYKIKSVKAYDATTYKGEPDEETQEVSIETEEVDGKIRYSIDRMDCDYDVVVVIKTKLAFKEAHATFDYNANRVSVTGKDTFWVEGISPEMAQDEKPEDYVFTVVPKAGCSVSSKKAYGKDEDGKEKELTIHNGENENEFYISAADLLDDIRIEVKTTKVSDVYEVTFDNGGENFFCVVNQQDDISLTNKAYVRRNDEFEFRIYSWIKVDPETIQSKLMMVDTVEVSTADGEKIDVEYFGYCYEYSGYSFIYRVAKDALFDDVRITVTAKEAETVNARKVSVANVEGIDTAPIKVYETYSEFRISDTETAVAPLYVGLDLQDDLYVDEVRIKNDTFDDAYSFEYLFNKKTVMVNLGDDISWLADEFEVYVTLKEKKNINFKFDDNAVKVNGYKGLIENNKVYPMLHYQEWENVEFTLDVDRCYSLNSVKAYTGYGTAEQKEIEINTEETEEGLKYEIYRIEQDVTVVIDTQLKFWQSKVTFSYNAKRATVLGEELCWAYGLSPDSDLNVNGDDYEFTAVAKEGYRIDGVYAYRDKDTAVLAVSAGDEKGRYTIPYYETSEDFTIIIRAVKDVEEYTVTFDSGDTGLRFVNSIGEFITKVVTPSHSTANDSVDINIVPVLVIDETTLESSLYTVDTIKAVDVDGDEINIEDAGYSSDSLLKYFYIPSGIL